MDITYILLLINLSLIALLNLMSFFVYGFDKQKAKKRQWRIPERALLVYGFIAPMGAFLGMHLFHHKTRKLKFQGLIPLFLFLQLGFFAFIYYQFGHFFEIP